jgi:hypothetical protein
MGNGIFFSVTSNKFHEFLHPPLLKNAHQGRTNSLQSVLTRGGKEYLHFIGRDFSNSAVAVYIATSNLLKLEITRDIGVLQLQITFNSKKGRRESTTSMFVNSPFAIRNFGMMSMAQSRSLPSDPGGFSPERYLA